MLQRGRPRLREVTCLGPSPPEPPSAELEPSLLRTASGWGPCASPFPAPVAQWPEWRQGSEARKRLAALPCSCPLLSYETLVVLGGWAIRDPSHQRQKPPRALLSSFLVGLLSAHWRAQGHRLRAERVEPRARRAASRLSGAPRIVAQGPAAPVSRAGCQVGLPGPPFLLSPQTPPWEPLPRQGCCSSLQNRLPPSALTPAPTAPTPTVSISHQHVPQDPVPLRGPGRS